jgi:hypothetical protein
MALTRATQVRSAIMLADGTGKLPFDHAAFIHEARKLFGMPMQDPEDVPPTIASGTLPAPVPHVETASEMDGDESEPPDSAGVMNGSDFLKAG